MDVEIVSGDILQQDVQVIVNAWNRNIIPWWLLLPQGVSGAIKRQAGIKPFQELARFGAIPLGEVRLTEAGKLSYDAIIHVAGINMFWCATEQSVINGVKNAMQLADTQGYTSVAFPLIGSGSGNRGKAWSKKLMLDTFAQIDSSVRVVVVEYDKV